MLDSLLSQACEKSDSPVISAAEAAKFSWRIRKRLGGAVTC